MRLQVSESLPKISARNLAKKITAKEERLRSRKSLEASRKLFDQEEREKSQKKKRIFAPILSVSN